MNLSPGAPGPSTQAAPLQCLGAERPGAQTYREVSTSQGRVETMSLIAPESPSSTLTSTYYVLGPALCEDTETAQTGFLMPRVSPENGRGGHINRRGEPSVAGKGARLGPEGL